jgi:hypothetical protein
MIVAYIGIACWIYLTVKFYVWAKEGIDNSDMDWIPSSFLRGLIKFILKAIIFAFVFTFLILIVALLFFGNYTPESSKKS